MSAPAFRTASVIPTASKHALVVLWLVRNLAVETLRPSATVTPAAPQSLAMLTRAATTRGSVVVGAGRGQKTLGLMTTRLPAILLLRPLASSTADSTAVRMEF